MLGTYFCKKRLALTNPQMPSPPQLEFSHGGSAEKAEIGHYRLLSCASDPRLFAEIHG